MGSVTQQSNQNNDVFTNTGLFPNNVNGTNLIKENEFNPGGRARQFPFPNQMSSSDYNPYLLSSSMINNNFPSVSAFTPQTIPSIPMNSLIDLQRQKTMTQAAPVQQPAPIQPPQVQQPAMGIPDTYQVDGIDYPGVGYNDFIGPIEPTWGATLNRSYLNQEPAPVQQPPLPSVGYSEPIGVILPDGTYQPFNPAPVQQPAMGIPDTYQVDGIDYPGVAYNTFIGPIEPTWGETFPGFAQY